MMVGAADSGQHLGVKRGKKAHLSAVVVVVPTMAAAVDRSD